MKKEQLAFLAAGLAFGILIGLAIDDFASAPDASAPAGAAPAVAAPAGPSPPVPSSAGGAPMMEEIGALRARVESNPNDLAALTRLANLYHDAGMWEPAKSFYERAIELSPDDPDLITDYGICFVGTRQFDRAVEQFERAQKIDSDHAPSLFNMAIVTGLYQGDFDRADDSLARLRTVAPDMPRLDELQQQLSAARAGAGS